MKSLLQPAFKLPNSRHAYRVNITLDDTVAEGWRRVMHDYFCESTSLIYTCPPAEVEKKAFFNDNGFRIWRKPGDYGHGLEDCAILGGVALSMLCDQFLATGNRSLADDARKIARGLINLATVHGVKGFIARGICVEDGKSVCALSSIDQHTHAVHGLWRYGRSGLNDGSLNAEIKRVLSEVADRMTAQVIEANDWSFLQATGTGPTRGITKMRFNQPHESMRLSMIYAAAAAVTGNQDYRDLYLKYRDEGLENSMRPLLAWSPDYTLLQMQTSLELVLAEERDDDAKVRILAAMRQPADVAAEHALKLGTADSQYLCGAGECQLAQLMAPNRPYAAEQQDILLKAIAAQPFSTTASCCRILHLSAAWWRLRTLIARNTIFSVTD